jgi:hypothetical protein
MATLVVTKFPDAIMLQKGTDAIKLSRRMITSQAAENHRVAGRNLISGFLTLVR